MNDMDYPPLPPTRIYHRGTNVNRHGRVTALCFVRPRAIDMSRATWTIRDEAVTCPRCNAMILARHEPPNVRVVPPL